MPLDPTDFETIEPQTLRWLPDGSVEIGWPGGHVSVYGQAFLRSRCPCASCKGTQGEAATHVNERSAAGPKKKASFAILAGPKPPPPEVARQVKAVAPVGNYAIRFTWGDGHDTGLYSFRYLRSICPCGACTATPALS